MRDFDSASDPCFSVRLLRPWLRLLRRYPQIPSAVLDSLEALDPDQRVPIATVLDLQRDAVAATGDADLGLKAAREIGRGDYGALEYVARSASTWGDACELVGRYMRLVNDALRYSLRREGDRTSIQLESRLALPRASADFQSGAFHVSAVQFWPLGPAPEFEVCFTHPAPDDTREYELTFAGMQLRFAAPFNGFVIATRYLDLPVGGADPNLHAIIRQHAEALIAQLPRAHSLSEKVSDLLAKQLADGTLTIEGIARQLGMGSRTLGRRLEQEGTAFRELVDEQRRRAAFHYLSTSNLALSEIAFLLGFSQQTAFQRAFKRWTRQTPLQYRTDITARADAAQRPQSERRSG